MRSVVIFAVFALAAGIIVPQYATQMHPGGAPPTMMAARPETPVTSSASDRSVVIAPGHNGHFEVAGNVDGHAHGFHGRHRRLGDRVDGARRGDARHPSGARASMSPLVRTANGTVRAAPVELELVEIDDLVVHDVAAMVLPDGALSDNLLGLSFLSRLRRFEYSDGKLVLEQ